MELFEFNIFSRRQIYILYMWTWILLSQNIRRFIVNLCHLRIHNILSCNLIVSTNRDRFIRISILIRKLAVYIIFHEIVISKSTIFTIAQQKTIITGHTVELDSDIFSLICFRIQIDWLNADGKVEIDDLEWSVENITN